MKGFAILLFAFAVLICGCVAPHSDVYEKDGVVYVDGGSLHQYGSEEVRSLTWGGSVSRLDRRLSNPPIGVAPPKEKPRPASLAVK